MSAWNLSPRVIIWAPSGSPLGHPYNYTHRQIPCTDVTMLQLLHVIEYNKHTIIIVMLEHVHQMSILTSTFIQEQNCSFIHQCVCVCVCVCVSVCVHMKHANIVRVLYDVVPS